MPVKADAKREILLNRLADYVLAHGLPGANLRPLAAAAGTSDRMLLYYFKDKEEIITATLVLIASRLMGHLTAMGWTTPGPIADREPALLALVVSPDLWPYMSVWLEIAAISSRGDPLYRTIGHAIAQGFLGWIASLLAIEDAASRKTEAARLLRSIEGTIVLHSVGLAVG